MRTLTLMSVQQERPVSLLGARTRDSHVTCARVPSQGPDLRSFVTERV